MAIFEVKKDNATFEIDAPDEAAALAAFKTYYTPQVAFETKIAPDQEPAFQTWKAANAPKDSGADYDLHGAFEAGVKPDSVTGHWPDTFKKPNHPTFSDQSQYAEYGKPGSWDGDTYIPAGGAKPPAEGRSYLSASAVAGLQTLGGATARVVADTYNILFGLSAEEVAILKRADPTFDPEKSALRYSPGTALEKVARGLTSDADKTMESVTSPEGKRLARLEYATLDSAKAAYLSPTRLAGDVLQSLPSLVALAVATRFGVSSGKVARAEVLAAGGTEVAANTAAIKAITRSVTTVGAGSEGAFGYGVQANSVEAQVRKTPQETLDRAPEYQSLLKEGYDEAEARNVLALRAGRMAGLVAGVVDAATNLASGPILGRIIGEGGGRLSRFGKGFLTEAAQESVQSVGEEFGANLAEQRASPDKRLTEGLLESAVQGFAVGGLMGGAVSSISGNKGPPSTPPSATPPSTPPGEPAAPQQTPSAAETEATLAKKKADALNGSEGTAPIVERVADVNETVEGFAAAANLAAGTVSNPVTVPDYIAQGYEKVPSGSEYRTRLTKTNDDNTVNTIEVGSNGAVESDLTVLGDFTINDAPVSVRFDNINSRLQAIEEDGNVTDLSDDANRKYTSGASLLDVLQAEDPGATIAPVALGETVAPAAPVAIEQNRDRSNPASVLQMQQIANAPDYTRAGVGMSMANDAPIVAGGAIPAEQLGRPSVATDTQGNRTEIQYAVVDASTVQTSNTVDGAVNPDYAGSTELRAIAGNGRITGFREAYVRGTADNYRNEFEADTAHGVDPEIIRSVPNPILVRVMSTADITSDMGDRTNTATQLGMNPEETARNDANRVDLDKLTFREDGAPTTEATRAFLRGLPPNERASLINGQVPTADATTRLNRAVFLKAYNDSALMDQLTTSEEGLTVVSVLTQLAPTMSRLSEAGNLDIRDIVVDAAKIVIKARNEGVPLLEAARQTDIEANPDANLVVALIAENPRGAKKIVEALRSVANFAYTEATKPETDMLGPVPRATRADVVARLRATLTPKGARLVMPGTETVAPPPSKAAELARLKGKQTKMSRTGQKAPGGIFTEQYVRMRAIDEALAIQQADLEARIENLRAQVDPGSVASRILSRTVEHLTAPTKASRVNLKSVLLNPEAKAGTDAQVVEAVDAAKAALASEGEATFSASKPDINKKRMTKLLGPQLYGNMSDIGIVTVKELFQNSFDGVKGALERGDISLGHITITTDSTARTITIVDDGGGMALDTINKAFLTMAGTEKDTARASGGLGIAKMLFLLGNKALRLETVRAGQIHRMDTTGEQIAEALDDSSRAPQIETRSTTAAPGTTVVVTLPETYVDTDTEEVRNIYFPDNYKLRNLIDSSPLFANIEVVLNGSARPVGARYELNGATPLATVNFAWGTARLLVRPNIDSIRGSNFNVLSEGLNQFLLGIVTDPANAYSDPVPYDFILNLEPTVKADSARYPIALNRKGFSPSGKSDMDALIRYVNVLYANKSEQDSAKSFGQLTLISQSPLGSVLKRIDLNIPDAAVGSVLSIDPSDVVTVTDGRVYVNNKLTPPLTKENIKAMRRDPAQFRVDQSQIDPNDIIVHDNILMDGKPLLEQARLALGTKAVNEFLRDFGLVFQELRAAVARVGGASYATVTQVPTGLSFDLEYYGVNTVIPFKAIMLNPLVVRDKETGGPMRPNTSSRADRAGTFVGTMVHELTHHAERNHSETGFIPELARLSVQLAVSGDMATAVRNMDRLLQRYDAVAEYFMERNANGNLTARGVRLDGDAERTRFQRLPERVVGPGGTRRDGADSVREGVGRGDTTGTRSQERGGPAAEGGAGAAVALPRRVLKGRVPELQDAADKVYAGLMSREEYQRLVDIYKPVRPFTSVPAMPTQLDLERGLRENQIARIGQETNIPEGEAVGLRLDIEAYTDNNVWAPTIHKGHAEGSKPIAHAPFARITDVDFGVSSDKALRVARGGPKSPFAKMDGFWTKTSAEDIQAMAEKFLNDPAWTQVGMDPERHEGFYDRRTQRQLAHADEVIQIGPLVLARNATFRNTEDTRFSVKSDKMGATGTAKAWVEFAEVKKLIDFGIVKTLAQAKAAAEADYTKTFDALPAFDAKAYLEGVIAVEGPLLPQNVQDVIQAYKNGDEGGAVGTLLADVKRAREENIARWKNYFDNVNTEQGSDPFWKSYVAHGVVNTFDATKPNTGETFNAAALATVYGKFLEGTAPNFTKAYRAAKLAATADLVELGDAQNGWRKVPRTAKSDPNFAERVAEVQAISSESWCTKTFNAAPYIAEGDFWVYVDKGRPELAIRFRGSDVAEIQGRANTGSIPAQYAGMVQALVDSGKIQNLKPQTKKALQDATDISLAIKKLESEATFVEEIDGDETSIHVYEKANGDIVLVAEGGRPSLPAQYNDDRVVEVIGNLTLFEGAQVNNLTTVGGDLTLRGGAQANSVTTVGGHLTLRGGAQANSVTTVGGTLYLYEDVQANSVTTVGGTLYLHEGAQANSVPTVGGDLHLYGGAQANSVTTVGGDLYLYEGAQANSVTTVGGNLRLREGVQANSVTTVGGNLELYEGAQANSVTTVGGDLELYEDAQVNNLTTVGGKLSLREGAQANSVTTVGGNLTQHRGAQANSVTTVGGDLYLYEGAQANSVTTVGGELDLYIGAQANSVTTVGGDLDLFEGAQANNVTTVGGTLSLREGVQANSVTTVGGDLNLYEGAQANSVTTVGGHLHLYEGAQANSVTTVGGKLTLYEDAQANSVTTVGGHLTLRGGAQANSVTTVGGNILLNRGAQANSVTTVGGNLALHIGAQANNLTTVGGILNLREGVQANSVTTVGGDLYLYEGAQANSVTTVGGDLYQYEGAQALSLQAVGGRRATPEQKNTPNLMYIGDKDAVKRIKAQTTQLVIGTALGGSMTVANVKAAVISALDEVQIGFKIYGTVEEARAEMNVAIPADAKGMYAQGKIHLFAENISNAVDAQITVWHEILHAGLDRLYKSGSKKYNAALVTIAARNPRVREEAAKWTKSFGADLEADAIRLGRTPERAAQYVRMRAIDEALAIMSSENVTIRGLDKFIAVVQNIIRQIGLNKLADAMEGKTNAEALALISKARGALLADGSYVVTDSAPAFLRGAGLQTRPLKVTGTGPNGSILNWDLGQAFTRAHKAQYGRVLDDDKPADRAEMVKSLNAEYRNQTRQPDHGEKWYVEDVASALKTTRAILPELRVPSNRDLFLTIAALTSPQQKPNQNWQNAIHAMRGYIKTGRIALVKPNETQFGVPGQTLSLKLLQHLIDTKGLAKTLRWLNASHSGQEIAEVRRDSGLYKTKATLSGYVASETNLTNVYLGIAMFGPKVSDFMLNATGIDPNAVTVDLWLARTYNRLLGRLTDVSPQKRKDQIIQSDLRSPTERNSIKSLIRDVAEQNGISPSAMQAALWYFEQRLYRSHGLNAPSQNFSGAASLAVGNERSKSSGNVQRAGRNEVPAVSGRGKTKKVVESIPYNAVQTTVRLNKLEDETDPVALKNGVVALARDLRVQAANRPVRERSRGYDWIQERLLRAARLGEMDREQVRLGMWLLNNNPNLANDLGISLRAARSDKASGNYNPMSRIMTLFKERGQETLIAHEILHHAERMMPEDIQAGIRAEWLSQITGMLDAAIRTNDTEMVDHLRDVLRAAGGDTTAYNRVADGIWNGTLSQDFYQYINPSEFWAVNAADIVAARANESWVQRAVQWLREFKAKIQELFGFPSNAAVIRGLDNVLNAANEGERQSPNMLSEGNIYNAMRNRTEPTLPVPSTFTERELDKNTYRFVDRFIDLKNLMKTIKSLAPALPERLEVYGMVERLTARVAKQVKDFGNREIDPLIKDMLARGVSVAELDNYLWMRAAPDANRIIAQQPDTKFPDLDGAGVSTADAQAYLAALTPKQRTAFEALAKRVDAITAKTRREWVRYGMATLDDVNKMEREQPYYVPFNREGKNIGAGTGQGVSVRGPNTFHRRGSERPVVDVLANIIHQRDRAVVRGEKNLISRAIYALAKTFPDAKMWSLASPGITSAIDAETGEPVSILDMSYQKDPNVLMSIRLDKNGKMVAQGVAFNEDNEQAMRMVGALKNLDLPSLEGIYASVARITRYFAALNTQYNPVFGLINLARDIPSGMLNLSTTALAGKQFQVAKLIAPVLASIYGATRAERQGLPPGTGKYAVYFERFQNAGGSTGWRDSFATSADRGKALQKELDSLSYGTARKILPAIGGWLSDYNTAMEGSTRLAAFIVAVESGLSDAQAASIAKNLTVNFDRKGAVSSQLGAWYAFFNPAVQGTVRTLETLRGPAGKKIIAGGLLLGAIQAVFLAMAGFDDDDPPEFVRQRNVIIPIGDKKYVSLPMPLGFNILPNIGRLAMQTALRPANIGKNVLSAMETVLSTFNPFGAGVTLQTFAPTVFDPFVAIGTDKDWTGKPIERKDFSYLDPTPGYTRAKDNASWISTIIAQGINTLTFGDKYTPGMVSPTPDLIDYIGGQLTGGPGRELLNLETALEGWFSGKEVPTYKIPVVGRFYGNTGTEASVKARYYENTLKINKLENAIKGMETNEVDSTAYEDANPMWEIIEDANAIKRNITDLRRQKKEPGSDDASLDKDIVAEMEYLNELAAPYQPPTKQQKFLRNLVTE